ncbi:quinone-dependent dihydroorotate dehydrogenase [Deinococcus sp. KNUC1210]|uniref:quinone-dependent dihydroorotate dehydrogenase n=1 Tax=Deinococcus sp. KNUC1210 TaxID=2917691 RepID=UPI001EF0CA60|nr:quinone-dependent dihydroorotate dehydrogenase [Deinococcus sp. KNUC1210]ULH16341.1 quinone-dependent dihydroorotate dehydrogenase [Deinococcus sp. KNUC1210]
MYARFAKPLLFRLDAERAHHLTMRGAALAGQLPGFSALLAGQLARPDPALTQTLWGQRFSSPLGLAAGLDKNAEAVPVFTALGFGFMEVGTVTPRPQPGNPLPRLFRLPEDAALINRMGFNNAGAPQMAQHLRAGRHAPVWVNIGKNKDTPNEEAADDYLKAVAALHARADGFVINVSSPNTPGLRSLQAADELSRLVGAVLAEVTARRPGLPVLVKLSPDMEAGDFAASVSAVAEVGVSGLIVSNTTLSRDGLSSAARGEAGGLSGRPLEARSTALIAQSYRLSAGKLPLVGVGGIFSAQDAYRKIRAGASLVELYTALIYAGPTLPARINAGLKELLRRDGFTHVSEAVGVDVRA